MKKNNYKEYDTLTLLVKKKKVDEIIERYKIFGWEVFEQDDNKRYEDIVDLIFIRKHKIENKDDLQLYQVYMEENLNNLGKLEKNKHSKSLAFGLSFGTIGFIGILVGILGLINFFKWNFNYNIASLIMGLLFVFTVIIFVPKIFKKENQKFENKKEILNKELKNICDKVLEITVNYEEK